MTDRRRGLGRGLGALIPSAPGSTDAPPAAGPSPVDLLIPGRPTTTAGSPAGPGHAAAGEPAVIDGAYFAELPLDAITPNPRQPRTVFDEDAMAELVTRCARSGCCSRSSCARRATDRYELIMGERRWRAAGSAGFTASRRSSGPPATTRCSATRCWRTCTAPSSTRWRRPPPTTSC